MSCTLFTKPKFTNITCILFMIDFYDCLGPRKKCTTHKHFWNSFLRDHETPFGLYFFLGKEPWSISLNLFLQMQCKGINKQNKLWHIFYGDMTFYGVDLLLHTLIRFYRIIDFACIEWNIQSFHFGKVRERRNEDILHSYKLFEKDRG